VLEVGLASSVSTGVWASEEFALVLEERSLDVLEDVSFGDDAGAGRADVEGVAGVVVPHVVDSVDKGGASDLWGTAGCVVDVV